MNDPHVVALLYQIEHGRGVDYGEAKPIDHEERGFRVEIENEQVCFEFKEHYETRDAARKAIEDYIRVWEFDASLREGPNHFKLRFKGAHIEDRKPTPGVMDTSASITSGVPKVSVMAAVSKPYPSPPSSGLKLIPDVQTMYDRYMGYLQDREPLASMGYFCLTILERSTKKKSTEKKKCRELASEMYRIELEVLDKIGHLSSERGGQQARKAVLPPLSVGEMTLRRECAILSWKLKRLPTPWFDDVGKNNIKPQEKGAEMGSLLRTAKKHKKSRRLGKPEVMAREEYGELEVDVKIEMIRSLIPLGLMHVHELLDDEVKELAGERYARKDELERGRRHGTNPGTVGLAGQRVPIRVPRVRSQEGVEIPLRSYEALNDGGEVNDLLLKRVLYGISCRNYEAAAEAIPGAIGLSSSTVSRGFVQASAAKLREMQERDLSGEDVVALFLDGKSFADAMMVIALGITLSGEKRFLGFVETDTENEKVLTPFLRSLLARGLDSSQGLLVIIDGGKGLKAAVKKAFRKRVLIQRCQWHKRENVVSYLSKGEQASLRKRLQSAYNRPEYKEALAALDQLHDELEERNQSAAGSLEEGIEETLTLHRLGVYGALGRSFKTTNCLESVNALVEERCAKVDHWKNSSQRQRWLATALVDIEPRLRRVIGYRHLPKLREALKRELKIETKTSTVSKKKAA